MAKDKTGKILPKGITWLEKKQLYMARFTYQGTPYTMYDKELKVIKKKLADKRYEVEHGLSGKLDKITLNTWYESWLNDYKTKKAKKSTIITYKGLYETHVRNTLGKKQLSQIKAMHIQKFYNDFIEKGYSASTLEVLHAMLSNIFKIAVNNDLIVRNPCRGTERPIVEHEERRVLSIEEQRYISNYIKKESWQFFEPIITVMLGTGIRVGEALGLKWEDIDFEKKTMFINKTLAYRRLESTGKFGFEEDTPKTANSTRIVPLKQDVIRALKRQKYNQNLLKLQGNWKPREGFETLVFTGKKGQPQTKLIIRNMLIRLVKEINEFEMKKATEEKRTPIVIEPINPHALRHSFATRCFEAEIPPKTVQMLLGHANIGITMNLYTHVTEQKKVEDMQKLDKLLLNVI